MQSFLVDGSRSTKWDLVEEPEEENKIEKSRGVGLNMNEDRKNLSILWFRNQTALVGIRTMQFSVIKTYCAFQQQLELRII